MCAEQREHCVQIQPPPPPDPSLPIAVLLWRTQCSYLKAFLLFIPANPPTPIPTPKQSHSLCRPGFVLIFPQDPTQKHVVSSALNPTQDRETCLDRAGCLHLNYSVPIWQGRKLATFLASICQSIVMEDGGAPQPYWNNTAKCVRPSAQSPFRDSPIPSHMLGTAGMFVFLYT